MISTQAPSLWALCAHAILLVVTLTGDKATPRERAPSPEENAIELHQIVGFTWLRGLFDRKAVLKDENLAVEDLPQQVEGDLVEICVEIKFWTPHAIDAT